jgi:hypothetical protein
MAPAAKFVGKTHGNEAFPHPGASAGNDNSGNPEIFNRHECSRPIPSLDYDSPKLTIGTISSRQKPEF